MTEQDVIKHMGNRVLFKQDSKISEGILVDQSVGSKYVKISYANPNYYPYMFPNGYDRLFTWVSTSDVVALL